MKLFTLIKKILHQFTTPGRVKAVIKTISRQAVNRLQASPVLPPNKTEVPMMLKTTVFPVPVVVCGAIVNGRPNFSLLGNFGIISPVRPNPIIYISTSKEHFTNIGIKNTGAFSINIPSRSIMAKADYTGVVSGHKFDKSNVMTVFYGRRDDVPCLDECPLNYICSVLQHTEIREKDVFIGEIIDTYVSRTFFKEGSIDIESMEPLIFTADGFYRVPSAPVGKAWDAYRTIKKTIESKESIIGDP